MRDERSVENDIPRRMWRGSLLCIFAFLLMSRDLSFSARGKRQGQYIYSMGG
jgi:hypothetical protein